jgi:two-component system response regulator AtoC
MKHSDTSIKKLLSRRPVGSFDPLARYGLILKLDEKGIVRHIIHEGPAHDLQRRFMTLKDQDIRNYFRMPKDKSIKALSTLVDDKDPQQSLIKAFSAQNRYVSKNMFEKYDLFYDFYTALPFSNLYLCRFPEYGVVGIVMITLLGRRAEYLNYLSANPFLLLDNRGIIQCTNSAFARYFRPAVTEPTRFLGKPVSESLDINPIELLGNQPEQVEPSGRIPWILEKEVRGFTWKPDPESLNLFPLKQEIDSTANWLRLKIDVNAEGGNLPLIILNGGKYTGDYFPDFSGYLIGFNPGLKSIRVKKQGETVFEKAVGRLDLTGKTVIEVERLGSIFKFLIDGTLLMQYHDPDPLEGRATWQFLYSRDQNPIIIEGIKLYSAPKLPGVIPPLGRITFLNKTDNAFEMRQLIDRMTLIDNRLYYGFIFYDVSTLVKERNRFEAIARQKDVYDDTLVGNHPSLLMVKEKARVAGAAAVTVLIEGETGTGKELLARYIHKHSPQATGPFIKVDCATLPQNLLESELFGYEKGAFTGATQTRVGRLEAAHGGTLFLDEIGNLDMSTQAKLLNFLQDFELMRLGSNKRIKVDTRIVTALNRPLKQLVDEKTFREDLYYRLNIVSLQIPPLKDRREDIHLLCRHFLNTFNKKLKRRIKDFSAESYQKLLNYDWPGNIRELENVIQKAMLFCNSESIGPALIELTVQQGQAAPPPTLPTGIARAMKRDHIIALLRKNKGIVAWAAKEARIGRATLYRKMRKFNIDPESLL